jgi:hypothetical protein
MLMFIIIFGIGLLTIAKWIEKKMEYAIMRYQIRQQAKPKKVKTSKKIGDF